MVEFTEKILFLGLDPVGGLPQDGETLGGRAACGARGTERLGHAAREPAAPSAGEKNATSWLTKVLTRGLPRI